MLSLSLSAELGDALLLNPPPLRTIFCGWLAERLLTRLQGFFARLAPLASGGVAIWCALSQTE